MVQTFECSESLTRRSLLKASAILTFAALPQLSFAAEPSKGRLLVILLRGGMDGLFAMPPIGDPGLKGKRKHLVPDNAFKLDGTFALHPALSNLNKLFAQGQALFVHGTSNPYTGRSHFEGQDIMESGAERPYASATGWLGRALEVSGYKAVTMTLPIPLILRGKNAPDTRFPTWISSPPQTLYAKLEQLWSADGDLATYGQQISAPQGMDMGGVGAGQDPHCPTLPVKPDGSSVIPTGRASRCSTMSASTPMPVSRASTPGSFAMSMTPSAPSMARSATRSGRTHWWLLSPSSDALPPRTARGVRTTAGAPASLLPAAP